MDERRPRGMAPLGSLLHFTKEVPVGLQGLQELVGSTCWVHALRGVPLLGWGAVGVSVLACKVSVLACKNPIVVIKYKDSFLIDLCSSFGVCSSLFLLLVTSGYRVIFFSSAFFGRIVWWWWWCFPRSIASFLFPGVVAATAFFWGMFELIQTDLRSWSIPCGENTVSTEGILDPGVYYVIKIRLLQRDFGSPCLLSDFQTFGKYGSKCAYYRRILDHHVYFVIFKHFENVCSKCAYYGGFWISILWF